MATGRAEYNPRVFRWGLCGHKVLLSRLRDCPTPKGLAPPKCSGVFLLVADRTDRVSNGLPDRYQEEGTGKTRSL